MTTFEYLAVLISIIVGLGITHLLGGIARFVHHPARYRLHWIHYVWIWYVFVFLLYFWWFQLWMNTVEDWSSALYVHLVLYSVLLYLLCVVITPPDSLEDGGFREYFFARRGWFFGVLLAIGAVDFVDCLIKDHGFAHWFLFMPLFVGAILTKNAKYHGFLALLFAVGITLGLFLPAY